MAYQAIYGGLEPKTGTGVNAGLTSRIETKTPHCGVFVFWDIDGARRGNRRGSLRSRRAPAIRIDCRPAQEPADRELWKQRCYLQCRELLKFRLLSGVPSVGRGASG